LPAADVVAEDVEVGGFREAAEAFLAVEVVPREEVVISLQVREVFPEVATPSLAVAVSLGAAVFLGAVAVVSPEAETISPAVVAAAFPEAAAVVFPAEAAAVPLDRIAFRTILHCSPILEGRGRVAVGCHRVRPEVNTTAAVHRWEEARHNYRPEIDRGAILEVGPHNFLLAMKAALGHAQVIFHPSALVGAMPAIFSASPAGSGLALRSARQPQIDLINIPRIVLAVVNSPLLPTNAQIGAGAR
jgi:hypothetical protein